MIPNPFLILKTFKTPPVPPSTTLKSSHNTDVANWPCKNIYANHRGIDQRDNAAVLVNYQASKQQLIFVVCCPNCEARQTGPKWFTEFSFGSIWEFLLWICYNKYMGRDTLTLAHGIVCAPVCLFERCFLDTAKGTKSNTFKCSLSMNGDQLYSGRVCAWAMINMLSINNLTSVWLTFFVSWWQRNKIPRDSIWLINYHYLIQVQERDRIRGHVSLRPSHHSLLL